MDIYKILEQELNLKKSQVENTIKLIDEGNTIPFIARYRKELTGQMDDTTLRDFFERLTYLRNLQSRKDDVKRLIEEQGKLTKEIESSIEKSVTLQEVEDIYAPYKQKKRTRATKAKEKGLEPLALDILANRIENLDAEILKYIDEEKEVVTSEDALSGANDIIAEMVSEDADLKKHVRDHVLRRGLVETVKSKDEESVYEMYYEYSEAIKTMAPHRILAVNRGEKEGFLKVKLVIQDEKIIEDIERRYSLKLKPELKKVADEAIRDSYKRLLYPSVERQIRAHLTEIAHERAIQIFGKNLKQLLLQPPIKNKVVMGFDPAYRTGCKIAVVDGFGKLLDTTTIYPTAPQNKVAESKKTLVSMIKKHGIDIIAIGNGTASRESEEFVANMIKEMGEDVKYTIVNEAGASVYSASKLAAEEYPDINVSIRGAISIGRRLQDPLSELVKIDPKSIGVGQYQHDVNQKRLEEVLAGVVESSVNSVGIDLNTASSTLLSYVSGVSSSIAKNIVVYREENGAFTSRTQLKKVKRLGPAAFTQCAGFLRISDGKNPLDNTAVHPESYKTAKELIEKSGFDLKEINESEKRTSIEDGLKKIDLSGFASENEVGLFTLKDIIEELKKPGRDPRDSNVKPVFRSDVLKIEDIKEGMIFKGTVRNIVDFGAFIDIGIKNDGLLHKSQMRKGFVKDPMEVVSVGDVIDVKVIKVDMGKKRVSLSIKDI